MFIVFEGIDGAGTETWSKFTINFLKNKGKKTTWLEFPDYKSPWGKIIRSFLDGKLELSTEMQFLTYATDILKDLDTIKQERINGYVVSDRYFISTMAYQCARGFPEEKALAFFELFNYPKPDLIILLLINVDESMRRKMNEHGKLDRHEKDRELLTKVNENYMRYSREKYFSEHWTIIDTSDSIEEVSYTLVNILDSLLE